VLVALIGDVEAQPNWYVHDLSFLSLQLALAAWTYGIGTCFIGNINRDKVKKLLGLLWNWYLFHRKYKSG